MYQVIIKVKTLNKTDQSKNKDEEKWIVYIIFGILGMMTVGLSSIFILKKVNKKGVDKMQM